jgi:ABC-2 type transport system ATP-binding protein
VNSLPAIQTRALTVIRGGNVVVDRLDVRVEAGSVVGLLGPSGCGKTTLIRSIAGIQVVASGDVSVLDEPAGSPKLRRRIAYMPQTLSLYGDLTVDENVRYFARIVRTGRERVIEVLDTVGLAPFAARTVTTLSGGQQARVSLAVALLGEPELLLLDEPTVGLDPVLRLELWETFHELARGGATLLVTSHVMDEADRCDRLLLMRDGAILAEGTPTELRRRTGAERFEDAFLTLIREGEG